MNAAQKNHVQIEIVQSLAQRSVGLEWWSESLNIGTRCLRKKQHPGCLHFTDTVIYLTLVKKHNRYWNSKVSESGKPKERWCYMKSVFAYGNIKASVLQNLQCSDEFATFFQKKWLMTTGSPLMVINHQLLHDLHTLSPLHVWYG